MSASVKAKAIQIMRMPGIRHPGFELNDLAPGVNILHGPNGSGKTSFGRAIILTLFGGADTVWYRLAPGDESDAAKDRRQLNLEANFVTEGPAGGSHDWRVRIDAGLVEVSVDGHPSTLSSGSPELAQRYRMGLAELLVESNDEFAREMLRQAAGGLDLSAVIEQIGWDRSVSRPRARQGDELAKAKGELTKLSSDQSKLARLEDDLAKMRDEEKRLRETQTLRRAIEDALKWHKVQENIAELEESVALIPAKAREIRSEATGRAELLKEATNNAIKQHEETRALLQDHDKCESDLSPQEIDAKQVDLSTARARVIEFRKATEALHDAKNRIDIATKALERESQSIGARNDLLTKNPAAAVADIAIDADVVAAVLHTTHATREQFAELHRQFEALAWDNGVKGDGSPTRDEIRDLLVFLAEWCKAAGQPPSPDVAHGAPSTRPSKWLWAAIVTLAVVSVALAAGGQPAAALGLLGAAIASWMALRATHHEKADQPIQSATQTIQSRFESRAKAVGVAPPKAWESESVGERIEELLRLLTDCERRAAANPVRTRLKALKDEARIAHENAKKKCVEFETKHNISLSTVDELPAEGWMPIMVRSLAAWCEAHRNLKDAEAVWELAIEAERSRRTDLEQAIKDVGLSIEEHAQRMTPDLAYQILESLDRRRNRFIEHERSGEKLRDRATRHKAIEDAADTAERNFWNDLELPVRDTARLEGLLAKHQEFDQLNRDLAAATDRKKGLHRAIGDHPGLLDRTPDDLVAELESLVDADAKVAEINRDIGAIEDRTKQAAEAHAVAVKRRYIRDANDALFQQERDWAASQVRDQVIAWARESVQQGVVTPVFAHAQRLLSEFTRGKLEFEVREGDHGRGPMVLARSHDSEAWRTVDRLSSGERIQLLMAIRLAFLEENEERMLPIFLDEVLGSSDDDRARHIIDAVIAIARTGRQVFYATAQADEVAKWRSRLEGSGIDYRVIDIGTARAIRQLESFPLPEIAAPQAPPAPAGCSHDEYGKALRVPGVDWSEDGVGSLHPWHVIEDPQQLFEVLNLGLTTLEQVERVTAHGRHDRLADIRVAMHAPARAYRAAAAAWRIGRGTPITRATIESADGVSDKFRESIWKLAEESRGDARRLVDALRKSPPPRWQTQATERLDQWFRSNGHLMDEDPLGLEQVMTCVIAELANDGIFESTRPETLARLRALLVDETA